MGDLRLLQFAGGEATAAGLWSPQLLPPGDMTRDSLLAALETAAQVSEVLAKQSSTHVAMLGRKGRPGAIKAEL